MNEFIYAIGGSTGPPGSDNLPVSNVEKARILTVGSLGVWQNITAMTTPRRNLKTSIVGNRIYTVG